ncbi:MAG TPA: WecB/TagA/CpsF family glycosyltransferase [Burkholderiales bacterium]|nr:WecB/TagA/CpsF family glycosyltransferase [Burkholderiales bacterium]
MTMTSVRVLGIPVAVTDYRGAFDACVALAARRDRGYLVEAANTHVVALARHNRRFGETMARFDLILPDGMPLVWSVNRKRPPGQRIDDRVYGPTFMLKAFGWSQDHPEVRHFLLGGKPETLEALGRNLAGQFPGARVVGAYSPPFGEWDAPEDARILALIKAAGASFVWVGLGCPKQEQWLSRMAGELPPAVYFGVGAAFAFHAGEVRQAPPALQRLGLEWLFRLSREPRRLFRRYLVYNSLFLYYSAAEMLGRGMGRGSAED